MGYNQVTLKKMEGRKVVASHGIYLEGDPIPNSTLHLQDLEVFFLGR